MADVPHFSYPFRFLGGKAVEVEQDSVDDIASCVHAILSVERGELIHMPEFGITDLAFVVNGADTESLIRAIESQEPRVRVAIEERWDFDQFVHELRVNLKGADVG